MVGKRVIVLPGHFDAGRKGVVIKPNETILGHMWYVRLDDGHMTNVISSNLKELQEV